MTAETARRSAATRPVLWALVVALVGTGAPALAQTASAPDAESRLRRVEAEVRALQRQVFPGSDGKFFAPEVVQNRSPAVPAGTPASSPMTDVLTRMEAVEGQLARLTAQNEELANRVAQFEARLTAAAPAATIGAIAVPAPAPSAAIVAPLAEPPTTPAPPPTALSAPSPAPVLVAAATPNRAAAKPVAARPSSQRIAAVRQVEKPQTGKAADDEYSYGFRLWDAKFYPEAAQQLRLYVDKYPRDAKISYGRNLLGRALLDDGKPREAAPWFLQNYQADKYGARAADSLLNLAEAMRQLKDTSRACIALAEFGETYVREASGRLKTPYETARSAVKCD
ncbi:MAG: hypothetical protein V4579_03730 [Pseudomonadota bacterium]